LIDERQGDGHSGWLGSPKHLVAEMLVDLRGVDGGRCFDF